MRCPSCGKNVPDTAGVCPYCSQRLLANNDAMAKSLFNARLKRKQRLMGILKSAAAILLGVSLIASFFAFYSYNKEQSRYITGDDSLFSEGVVPVFDGEAWRYINKSADATKQGYTLAFSFADSLAPVCTDKNEYYYISHAGKAVLGPYPITLSKLSGFCDGFALVPTDDKKIVYIDKSGKILGGTPFSDGRPFKNGCAAVSVGGKWGYIRTDGNIVIDFNYDSAGDFSYDGYAAVKRDGKWGFIDKSGKTVIDFEYDSVHDFVCGLCAVHTKTGWKFIDADKNEISAAVYSDVTDFSKNGLAGVNIDGKWGYIDRTGEIMIAPQYMSADKFAACSLAVVQTRNGFGIINAKGDFVLEDKETSLSLYDDGYAVFANKNKTLYGIYDVKKKKVLIEPQYRFISYDRTYYRNIFDRYKTF